MISSVIYRELSPEECSWEEACKNFYYANIDTESSMVDEVVDFRTKQGDLYRKLASKEAPDHKGIFTGGINISGKSGKPILIINE